MDIDVVVLTYNRCDLLERCLACLKLQTVSHRVIVADNGSEDGSASMVAERYPEVDFVAMGRNIALGEAMNVGVRAGRGDAVVLLNNDMFCEPTFLEHIVAPLEERSRIGMVASVMVFPDKKTIDAFGLEIDAALASWTRLSRQPVEAATAPATAPVLGPSGGAGAYLRTAFEEVGGFDPALFAYHEDVDLALRLQLAGWRCALAPGAIGVHIGSATIKRGSTFQRRRFSFGRFFIMRRYGVANWTFAGVRTVVTELAIALLRGVMSRDARAFTQCLAGWRAGGRGDRLGVPMAAVNRSITYRERLWRGFGVVRSREF